MKKWIFCLLLALAFVFVSQPQVRQQIVHKALTLFPQAQEEAAAGEPLPSFTDQMGTYQASDTLDVTLYFRYEDTGLLSAHQAQLDIRREETIATSIVRRLIEGPDAQNGRLEGLFPRGTRVVSVSAEGATVFVTLSRAFLGMPDGAPADWEDLTIWQEEAALRRMLAVQSLVLSLTEDGRYQRVQVYVADHDDDVPERIPMAYFSTAVQTMDTVLGACSRDESFLMTPQRVLERMLQSWQQRDYVALYNMLSDGRDMLPAWEVFETKMHELDVSLLEYETTVGSVSFDGKRATLVLSARIRTPDGGDTVLTREAIPLRREGGSWMMNYDTLLSLMIRD